VGEFEIRRTGLFMKRAILILCFLQIFVALSYPQPQRPAAPKLIKAWNELATMSLWEDVRVDLIVPGSAGQAGKTQKISAKVVSFQPPGAGSSFYLALIDDPNTQETYIIRGVQTFYVSDKVGLTGYFIRPGGVRWDRSYVRVPTSNASNAVQQFVTTFNTDKLAEAVGPARESRISLGSAAPSWFFQNGRGSSQPAELDVASVEVVDQLMRLELRNVTSKMAATIWIDRREHKLVRSVVDGREMDITKPFGGVTPTGPPQ
jgi:hypothetical protein